MKNLNLCVILLAVFIFASCGDKTKETVKDVGKKIDTLADKVGKQIDTIAKDIAGKDTLFDNAKVTQADTTGLAEEKFRESLSGTFKDYLDVKSALVKNDSSGVPLQANQLKKSLSNVKPEALKDKMKSGWETTVSKINKAADEVAGAITLAKQRMAFGKLTDEMTSLVKTYGMADVTIYRLYCADANGRKGGYWLTDSKNADNPYGGLGATAGNGDKTSASGGKCAEVKEAWKFN